MSNMSYCRFRNTHTDLLDCIKALEEQANGDGQKLSPEELRAAKSLVKDAIKLVRLVAEHGDVDLDTAEGFEQLEQRSSEIVDEINGVSNPDETSDSSHA